MKSSVVSGENRGSVNVILLKALQSGDKYGYEINKEIEAKSGGKFFLKEASLYSGLKRLQASGHITSYWQDGENGIRRHYYSITEKGLNKLNNSNFTWDSSKNFLGEMFSDQNQQKQTNFNYNNTLNSNLNSNSNENLNANSTLSQNSNTSSPVSENNGLNNVETVKKNPFQIEVNPLQQSFFDSVLTSDENLKNEDETNLNKEKSDENETQNSLKVVDENVDENVKVEDKTLEKHDELSYENMIKSFDENNYSTSLQKENVIDIASLMNLKNKEETEIFEKTVNSESFNFDATLNNSNQTALNNLQNNNVINDENNSPDNNDVFNNKNNIEQQNFEDNSINNNIINVINEKQENLNVQNVDNTQNFVDENKLENESENKNPVQTEIETRQKSNLDFKNIFGSLLVDDSKTKEENSQTNSGSLNINFNENEKIVEENSVENQISVKPELPRVDVDNNVNVMLNKTNKYVSDYTANNAPNRSYEDKIVQNNASSSFGGVKQYINNVRKQTLISRATNINEEVNLEGINIREYSKMNNKLIHNSNYVYVLKLNFVLALVLALLISLESVVFMVVLSKSNSLSALEIIFFVASMLFALIYALMCGYKYFKDKFRVEFKNYNIKSQLFSFILIFIVAFVLILCINIFAGMNVNNSFDFATKIVFESVVLLNLILFPILKFLFYKLKRFSN